MKNHLCDIQSMFHQTKVDAIGISETWYSKKINSNLVSLPNFNLIRHDRSNKRRGGVAIYLRNNFKYKIIVKSHNNSIVEYIFIEINNGSTQKLAFGVEYNPPPNKKLDTL